ncbi:hypothetical protein ICY_04697 [Bacillus cereus BAG2X1-3]|nr:hypothetical protein ICY_04697 [Bacillus cereus BAG2X1-3]
MRDFKGTKLKQDIISVAVSYYYRFSLSSRNVFEILKECCIAVLITIQAPFLLYAGKNLITEKLYETTHTIIKYFNNYIEQNHIYVRFVFAKSLILQTLPHHA